MAVYVKGALGAFSGKVGNLIGSKWRSIDYMRSLPRPSKRSASKNQIEVRAKFAHAHEFLNPIRDFIKMSYPVRKGSKHDAFDKLMSNLMSLIEGSYPNYSIRYKDVELSKGSMSPVRGNFKIEADGIKLVWKPRVSVGTAERNDLIHIILYHVKTNDYYLFQDSQRSDGLSIININEIPNKDFHAWTMASNAELSRFSNSTYHRILEE